MESNIRNKTEMRLEKWKNKAKARSIEIQALKKREKELYLSREKHKAKWKAERAKCFVLERKLNEWKHLGTKVKHHSYDMETMELCLSLKSSNGVSYRTFRSLLLAFCFYFNMELKIPCINTLRTWENKLGYYRIHQQGDRESAYMLLIDESFQIGRQSLMLCLAVNLNSYRFGESLNYRDVEVVSLGVKPSWKSIDIEELLRGIEERGYRIVYGCSDGGSNIVKALKSKEIPRVYDCTHALSLAVKRVYEKEKYFGSFLDRYAHFNRSNYMGKDRLMCPPKLKGKCRFLNIYPIAEWSQKWLEHLRQLENIERGKEEQRVYEKLLWLRDYEELIGEFAQISKALKMVFKILKPKGLSKTTIEMVKKELAQIDCPAFFRKEILEYLQQNHLSIEGYDQIICCSDIIESLFGKFKNNQKRNPEKGITIGCLGLANVGRSLDHETIKMAMENTRIVDLEKWRDKNKLESFNKKRNKLVKSWGKFFSKKTAS